MPQRNDWSTCDVCGELHERIVLFEFREGLYFEICQPCMVAAQQLYALDAALVAPAEHNTNSVIVPAGEVGSQPRQ